MKRIFILTMIVHFMLQLYSQDIRTSRNTSYYTYVYKLTNKQAEDVYRNNTEKIDHFYYSLLIDSFPTNKIYVNHLPIGHYLYVQAINNQLNLEIYSVNNVDLKILNNSRDLSLMVHDLSGKIITDAEIKIGRKKISFNKHTNTYILEKTNRKGLLMVTYLGHKSYFKINAEFHLSKFRIANSKILYKSPVKFVAIPVTIVIRVPYDTYRLARYQRFYGIYYYIKKPFSDIYQSISYGNPQGIVKSIAQIFTKRQHQYNGYMVFNKPKYLPGDTVFLKAYIMDENYKPVTDSLMVELVNSSTKKLGFAKLSKPGVYTFQFVASRSLGLKLDKIYRINLTKDLFTYFSGSFRFEDYELKNTKYEFRVDKLGHHKKDRVAFYCKGTDENDLQIPDARIELLLLKENVIEYYKNRVYVPDTLWEYKQNLDPLGETKIIIPDSIFPEAALRIKAVARFLNSNNELQTKTEFFVKDNQEKEIIFKLNNDTVCIDFFMNGISQKATGQLSVHGQSEKQEITLPYRLKLNPFVRSYQVSADSIYQNYMFINEDDGLQCFTNRDKDSVWVSIKNPHQLPVTYTIFRKDKPIFRGSEKKLNYVCKSTTKENYSVSVQYVWANEIKSMEYTIPFYNKKLKVNVIEPSIVFPGQTAKINVLVTDAFGNPAPEVDITALAFTKKFETNSVPSLNYYGKQYNNRSIFNRFNVNENFDQLEGNKKLNWKYWNPLFSLDTIERFRFLYPENGYYQSIFHRSDSTFAEVSPFLVDSIGNILPVNILYIDHEPVYLSITTNPKPYVFRINEGNHSIKIRTTDKEIEILSVYFRNGTKTIISVNPYAKNPKYRVNDKTPWYSSFEQNLIRGSVCAIRPRYSTTLSFINQGNNYEVLNYNYYNTSTVIGPFKQSYFKYQKPELYNVNTFFEPGFEYEFSPGLVKMKCWGILNGNRNYLDYKKPSQNFNDSVYTYEDIMIQWKQSIHKEQANKPVYNNPTYSGNGNAMLNFIYSPHDYKYENQPKNFLIFSYSDTYFIRIYPGNEKNIYDLKPGLYRIETLLNNNSLIVSDSILVKPNGTNYCRYDDSNILPASTYTDSISAIIQKRILGIGVEVKYFENYREEREKINDLAKKNRKITITGGNILRGKVFDASTGEPLPGVNIIIEGTTEGTVSNIDGEFEIVVPDGSYTILTSFVGYVTEKLTLNHGAKVDIQMVADIKKLDEVVVVGYGVQRSSNLTGSITSVNSNLSGRVAGVTIDSGSEIKIRGLSSTVNGKDMLYVVDGIPQEPGYMFINNGDVTGFQILKDASATAIYGSRAANGVIIITTKNKSSLTITPAIMQNKAFLEGAAQSKSIRNRFSDYAFWKPDLTTNKQGIASFEVTFPDDITSWKTYYLAMGEKGSSGQIESEIKAFKPIVSSLALPRFMVKGDTINILGKSLNYTQDSIQIRSSFRINDSLMFKKDAKIMASRIDTFELSSSDEDSVKIQYQISRDDGYSDGEIRYIPVFPSGTIETKGNFYNLEGDTTISMVFDKSMGKVTLHAEADIINILLEETEHLRNYRHLCNEQLSSKLKAMLWERRLFKLLNKQYKYDNDIQKIIKQLEERRNADSLWGWWQNGETEWWISLHAGEALKMAQNDSFGITVNMRSTVPYLYSNYHSMYYRDQIRAVKLLKLIDTVPDYKQLIDSIKINKIDTVGRYELWELKQLCGIKFPMDSLKKEQKITQFGNYYWGTECYSLFDDAVSATLVAYRILRNKNSQCHELRKIRNYFLERKGNTDWYNTWQTSRILETILPDLIKNKELNVNPQVQFSGALIQNVSTFPYHKEIEPGDTIYLQKKSAAPVYFTAYQQVFNSNPQPVNKDFTVNSYFENNDTILKAGQPVKLFVEVVVKKASEYVMIEIPIPAGCSYQDKNSLVRGEDYREYFKEKVCIYLSRLSQKKYTFEISLLPRFNGLYHLNPSKAELMYFPVFFGRERLKSIRIR